MFVANLSPRVWQLRGGSLVAELARLFDHDIPYSPVKIGIRPDLRRTNDLDLIFGVEPKSVNVNPTAPKAYPLPSIDARPRSKGEEAELVCSTERLSSCLFLGVFEKSRVEFPGCSGELLRCGCYRLYRGNYTLAPAAILQPGDYISYIDTQGERTWYLWTGKRLEGYDRLSDPKGEKYTRAQRERYPVDEGAQAA